MSDNADGSTRHHHGDNRRQPFRYTSDDQGASEEAATTVSA
jgi:hypothetical protein